MDLYRAAKASFRISSAYPIDDIDKLAGADESIPPTFHGHALLVGIFAEAFDVNPI
jgi:hypothetical protein